MGAAALIAGVLAKAPGNPQYPDAMSPGKRTWPLALATLIHGYGSVIRDLQEWNHSLAGAVGAFDPCAGARMFVQSLPRPPAHFERFASSATTLKMCSRSSMTVDR